ncbi:MAG TPA: metal-dependent hydrolase, partial [Candidatus Thermoplasmatota archaeon]|nr:metal-dependent hydrolase [Candidatus Thermoplasmatota archaeon]
MDGATHFLVPYAAALLALGAWRSDAPRHRVAWAASFGIGGWAPDADVAVDWMTRLWPSLYLLQHRGFSHSLLGAPVFALAVAAALAALAAGWPRVQHLRWARGTVLAALLGSLTHLALDSVTYGGVPLLWPFASGRVMWPAFHWLVWWLFPIGLALIGLHLWGRLDRRAMVACGAAFVLVLAGVAAVRLAGRPEAPPGGHVYPRGDVGEWVVLWPEEGGWRAELVRDGAVANSTRFLGSVPPGAEEAVARARATAHPTGGVAAEQEGEEAHDGRRDGAADAGLPPLVGADA